MWKMENNHLGMGTGGIFMGTRGQYLCRMAIHFCPPPVAKFVHLRKFMRKKVFSIVFEHILVLK